MKYRSSYDIRTPAIWFRNPDQLLSTVRLRTDFTFSVGFFILLSWFHMLFETYPFLQAANTGLDLHRETVFHFLAWSSYSFIYLLPALVGSLLVRRFFPGRPLVVISTALLLTTSSLLFIRIDQIIFDLYRFHFNGFVLNLLLTPGGIESLGGDSSSYLSSAMIGVRLLAIQAVLLFLICLFQFSPVKFSWPRWAVSLLILAMLIERIIYGVSDIQNYGNVLDTARVYPFYTTTTFRTFAGKMGIKTEREKTFTAKLDRSRLQYPLIPVSFDKVENPPNIVWLVAESLRWDRLTPEIMPHVFEFSRKSQNFTHHYSSGNGTREGMFGMFYGLYGSYWSNFLHAEQSPLLIDRIQNLDYQMHFRTSARFSYPEFDKTIFANIDRRFLHEKEFSGQPWQMDESNTSALIDFISRRDQSRPFMAFMFFESTHARYTFPDSARIRTPILEKVDYADMSREKLTKYATQLKNRYTNASYWVDSQMGRILTFLKDDKLLDNTIVIVTGDHGEEFMEKGFWGHNSTFVDEQVRTPLVVSMPDLPQQTIDRPTSHMDVPVTLLKRLGITTDPGEYSLGQDLFSRQKRDYIVMSDNHSIGLLAADFKYRIPYDNKGFTNYKLTGPDDSPYEDDRIAALLAENRNMIIEAIGNCSLFTR